MGFHVPDIQDPSQAFHNKHEVMTERIYQDPELLPDRYNFVLTNRCNLKCPFCFLTQEKKKNAMKVQDWISLAMQLPDYARVTFTGGEPLVFPGFEKIFSYVAKRFDCNIITNGTLLTKEKIDLFLSYSNFKVLSVSIDNIGNTLRGMTRAQWERVRKMMNYFATKKRTANPGCLLEAKTLILDENARDLFKIRRYCAEELMCDHQSFQFLKGSPLQHADMMFPLHKVHERSSAIVYKNFDTICRQLEKIRQYNVKTGKKAFLHPKIADLNTKEKMPDIAFINSAKHIGRQYNPCKFAWSSVHVNADGDLFPCMAIAFGNVKKTPLAKIIKGKTSAAFKDIVRHEKTVEGCNRCGWLRPVAGKVL